MDQMTQQFMSELQEFVHKAQKFLQSQGGNFGQRGGYYGMRDNGGQGGGYNQGNNQGGSYGQREPWMQGPHNYPDQNGGGWGNPLGWDPRLFM